MRGFRKPNTNHSQSSLRKKTKIENVLYAGNPLFCSLLQEDEKSKTQITEIFSGAILDPLKQEIIFLKLSVKFMSDIKLDI